MILNIKKINPNAIIPTYGSDYAAGLDLYACSDYLVLPKSRILVSTGIAINWVGDNNNKENPLEYYMRIAPRSGLSVKNSIDIGAGIIDSDYRGEIKICLINNGNEEFKIQSGDRVAQMILERIKRFNQILQVDNLDETSRGSGGFGSTGK